jgi:hypothetical protein
MRKHKLIESSNISWKRMKTFYHNKKKKSKFYADIGMNQQRIDVYIVVESRKRLEYLPSSMTKLKMLN